MRPGDLAPDDADLGAPDLLLAPVDVGDLLAKVEAAHDGQHIRRVPLGPQSPPSIASAETYLAALVLSTPSILIRLVPGWVTWRER